MSFLGNLIWLVFGGILMAIGWVLAALIMAISIIGLPWVKSCFIMAQYSFSPFGHTIVDQSVVSGKKGLSEGPLGLVVNIIWFVFAGIWLAIGHVFAGVLTAITIIGIPFAWQHFKLARVALAPLGKTVVTKREAELLRASNPVAVD